MESKGGSLQAAAGARMKKKAAADDLDPDAAPPFIPTAEELAAARDAMCAKLAKISYLHHGDPLFMHGRGYEGRTRPPRTTWKSTKPPRDDHSSPDWLKASEFQDLKGVNEDKCQALAALLRMSRKTVLYTGAGISASVIGQAARSGANTQGWKGTALNRKQVPPTTTHQALGLLGRLGLVHSWVQQNHDGLPQKAGFPQEHINEIHGSWFDPSNPVVKYVCVTRAAAKGGLRVSVRECVCVSVSVCVPVSVSVSVCLCEGLIL